MLRTYSLVGIAAVLGLLGGVWTYSRTAGDGISSCATGSVAGGLSAIGGPFELVSHQGETVTDKDVITGPTLLYFGYTFCPDICPADTARNAVAVDLLQEDSYDVVPVMISIDPERDTPEVMADYVFNMHEKMIGLTGTPEQVKAASRAYKTYYRAQDADDDEFYLVDHSTFTYLVFPEHGVMQYFDRDTTPQEMAESTACFIDELS